MTDFALTDTQKQILDTAREFGRKVLQPAEIALDRIPDPQAAFASDTYRQTMAAAFALGFHKMTLPEAYGGLGLDPTTSGMVWEELARYGVGFTAGLLAGSVVPGLISFLAANNQSLIDRYVIPFCADTTGTLLTAWGSSEPQVGSDGKNYGDLAVHHRTTARKVDGGYLLNGAKSAFVSNGGLAATYVVFACVDASHGLCGSGAFVVPGDLKTSVTAKILATEAALQHTAEMLQVLGGYGITRDYHLEKYLRDAQLLPIMDGTNDTLMMEVTARF